MACCNKNNQPFGIAETRAHFARHNDYKKELHHWTEDRLEIVSLDGI